MTTTILAIDAARSSGWCILVDGKHHSSGVTDAFGDGPRQVCAAALALDSKAVAYCETPWGGSLSTVSGIAAARGCWQSAWRFATGKKSLPRFKTVMAQVWRSQAFGSAVSFPLQEKLCAQLMTGETDVHPDRAAAVCIARWASTRAEVERKAPAPNQHRVRNGRRSAQRGE